MTKRPEEPKKGSPAWMATFSDLMTQILVFFVFMYSMSTVDLKKANMALASFRGAFGGSGENNQSVMVSTPLLTAYPETAPEAKQGREGDAAGRKELEKTLEEIMFLVKANDLEEYIDGRFNEMGNIEIQLKDSMLFKIGQAEVDRDSYPILKKIGEVLKEIDNHIIVEGHTDSIPVTGKNYNSNWELSSSRALSVAKYFINSNGLPPAKLSIAGFGEYKPLVPNTTPENRAKNRRVTIVIVKKPIFEVY